jgi:hypothetical protein
LKLTRKLTAMLITLALILGTVNVSATAAGMPFTDVKSGDWYYNHVTWAADNKIVSGYPDSTFRPSNTMTRAEFVQVLYSLEGRPTVTAAASFSDVASGDWFATAVSWAVGAGVTSGVGGGQFAPSGSVTREQAVMFLYKYAQLKGDDKDYSGVELSFGDKDAISAWAVPAVQWSAANSVVSGYPDGTFGSQNTATRAEVVTILHRYVDPAYTPPDYSAYEFPYNIDAMIADAKAYGASIGGVWIEELTPDNCSWEAPGGTYANYSGENLRNGINGRIARIKMLHLDNHPEAKEFFFKVLFVPRDEHSGEYEIYFLMG